MRIHELEVKGFRSLRHINWAPGRLNVVIGANGSGKSNILRSLEFIKIAAEGGLPQEILDNGGITQTLWDESGNELFWRLKTVEAFEYQLQIQKLGWANDFQIIQETLATDDGFHIARYPNRASMRNDEGEEIAVSMNRIASTQTLLSLSTSIGDLTTFYFREILSGWSISHDMRVDRSALIRQAAVARVESYVSADGQNLIPVLHTLYTGNREFKRATDAAMRAAFGADYEEIVFPPAADQRVQLRVRWRSLKTEQSAFNLSDGTLRFLLLVAILANPKTGNLIAIDEPETGLHPGMFPIIAELAMEAAERTQVIFTTHSPQFLDAFRDQPPTTTVAEWVDGETHLSVLDGDELQRWLKEYSLGALFRSGELEAMA
jgi:predicted ATPase